MVGTGARGRIAATKRVGGATDSPRTQRNQEKDESTMSKQWHYRGDVNMLDYGGSFARNVSGRTAIPTSAHEFHWRVLQGRPAVRHARHRASACALAAL